jgi:hypothetical protein
LVDRFIQLRGDVPRRSDSLRVIAFAADLMGLQVGASAFEERLPMGSPHGGGF